MRQPPTCVVVEAGDDLSRAQKSLQQDPSMADRWPSVPVLVAVTLARLPGARLLDRLRRLRPHADRPGGALRPAAPARLEVGDVRIRRGHQDRRPRDRRRRLRGPARRAGASTSPTRSSSCSGSSPSTAAGCSPARRCSSVPGATSMPAGPARSTSTSGGCGQAGPAPASSSRRSATSATRCAADAPFRRRPLCILETWQAAPRSSEPPRPASGKVRDHNEDSHFIDPRPRASSSCATAWAVTRPARSRARSRSRCCASGGASEDTQAIADQWLEEGTPEARQARSSQALQAGVIAAHDAIVAGGATRDKTKARHGHDARRRARRRRRRRVRALRRLARATSFATASRCSSPRTTRSLARLLAAGRRRRHLEGEGAPVQEHADQRARHRPRVQGRRRSWSRSRTAIGSCCAATASPST